MNPAKPKKVLVIGLDGAPWELMRLWIRESALPNITKLAEKGVTAPLTSVLPLSSAPSWSSIVTGKNPGKHGIFEFMCRRKDSYDLSPVNSTFRAGKAVWDILGEHDKKVCVINVPFTYPPKRLNGHMITGMMTPPGADNLTYPLYLKEKINKAVNGYEIDIKNIYRDGKEASFLKNLTEVTEKRALTASFMMNQYEWDLFMVVFTGTDRIQHFFWKFMDPEHPSYSAKKSLRYKNAIFEYYQKIDDVLGRLLCGTSGETTTILLSDHGMSSMHKRIHLNNLLIELGFLKLKKGVFSSSKKLFYRIGLSPLNLFNMVTKFNLATGFKQTTAKMGGVLKTFFLSLEDIDWSMSTAYSTMGIGQIYLNLSGREPEGTIPSEDYEKERKKVIQALRHYRDPSNDTKIFKHVFSRDEIYEGPYLDSAPDIVVVPNPPYGIFTRYSFGSGSIFDHSAMVSGTHRMRGFLLLSGPEFQDKHELKYANILDIAPTLLHSFEVPIPEDMDGQVLTHAFNDVYLKSHPVRFTKELSTDTHPKHRMSKEEEKKVRARLKNLGYL